MINSKFAPRPFSRSAGAIIATAALFIAPTPALAQDDEEARLRRAEAEIRALQRAVFPGGDGRFFEPQIAANAESANASSGQAGAPATTAVTDILARLDAIEGQLQRLTALTEENMNALSGLDTRVSEVETLAAARGLPDDGRIDGMGGSSLANDPGSADEPSIANVPAPGGTPRPLDRPIATEANLSAMTGRSSDPAADDDASAPASGPSPERLAAVQAITKPQTDDPADDEYSYGFRLWNAGFYPEARQQLASYVEEHSDHFRVTYGRNLLGRAFLDDNMPEEAARWFLRNYQADRTARRAPDSLLYLAEAMIAMDDTTRACIALAEFGETYPAVATGRLADQYEANRRRVTCE